MNMLADPKALARDAVIYNHESKSLLRFIACGSVDHGKSSLLGVCCSTRVWCSTIRSTHFAGTPAS